jgi:hypothetical protein
VPDDYFVIPAKAGIHDKITKKFKENIYNYLEVCNMVKFCLMFMVSLISGFFLLVLVPGAWGDAAVDHSLYAELLTKYVKDGVVDYQGFKNEEMPIRSN